MWSKMSSPIKKRIILLRSNSIEADSRVLKEASALIENGYEVSFFGWDRARNHSSAQKKITGVDATIVGIKSAFGGGFKRNLIPLIRFNLCLFFYLLRYHKSFDVIHACDFDTAFAASAAALIINKPLVYDIFDYYVDSFSVPRRLKKTIERFDHWVMDKSKIVIVCTENRREQIQYAEQDKVIVIHNAPPMVNCSSEQFGHDSSVIKLVYVGILQEGRLLRELLAEVESNTKLELDIAGFGQLESVVKSYSLRVNRIRYYGQVPYDRALELESCADVMLALYDPEIPNHKYAAPNKFYEALMFGKPLIVTKGIGIDRIIEDEGFGVSVDYTQEGLRKGISRIVELIGQGNIDTNAMKKYYIANFSWDEMKRRLIDAYARLT